jgi:hypothetical protein
MSSGHTNFQQAYPPAPVPPPAPASRGRLGRALTVGFVMAVAFTGGSVLARHRIPDLHLATGLPPPAATNPAVLPTNAAGADHGGDLRRLLPARPAGVRNCDGMPTKDEQLTVEQAASIDEQPADNAAFFKSVGFRRGVLRCWLGADSGLVIVVLFQFDTVAHAVEFDARNQKRVAAKYGVGSDIDPAVGVPGAHWFRGPPDRRLPGYTVINVFAQRGDIVVDIALAQPTTVPTPKINEAIQAQYNRL